MSDLRITEVLPEGDDRAWITLSDEWTRLVCLRGLMSLPTHQTLRLNSLARRPRLTADGQHVVWPGGAAVDVASVLAASSDNTPLGLLALVAKAQRYRPIAAVLKHIEHPAINYLDVRPDDVVRSCLGLSPGDVTSIIERHGPVGNNLMMARLSDLLLLLRLLVPQEMLPSLLRQRWPYAQQHGPEGSATDTALGCLRFGRIDLVEAPLFQLLLPPFPGAAGAQVSLVSITP